jgi:hypothetical protein
MTTDRPGQLEEVLVVDGPEGGRWRVVARAHARVAVLRATEAELDEIGRRARYALARTADGGTRAVGDEGVLRELDEGARLFVQAWRQRPVVKPDRRGEGQAWDAPGFEPPGRPRS